MSPTKNSLLNSGRAALTDDMSVLWRKGGENVIIVCLMHGEMGTGVFILERCVDGCSLYVGKMGKVSFDSCSMTLIDGCFWGGRRRNGVCWQQLGSVKLFESITVVKVGQLTWSMSCRRLSSVHAVEGMFFFTVDCFIGGSEESYICVDIGGFKGKLWFTTSSDDIVLIKVVAAISESGSEAKMDLKGQETWVVTW